jgi:ribosomal protein L23
MYQNKKKPGVSQSTLASMKNFAKLLFVITERDKKIEIRKEVLA